MDSEEYEPDCFELESWIYDNHPKVYHAVHFLNPSVQYKLHLKVWEIEGKPKFWE